MRHWSYASVLAVALATTSGSVCAAEPTVADPPQTPAARKLDLRIPPIISIYTPEQIAALLAKTRDADLEEVEVEGRREPPPPVTPTMWGGNAAPIWALLNLSQSWRIFAPWPPDQLRNGAPQPVSANAFYIEPAARTARDL